MPELLKEPLKRILDIYRETESRKLLAIAGYPGSGKTTVARQWEEKANSILGPSSFMVVGMDGFHRTKEELRRMENPELAFARRGLPWTFNPESFLSKLRELKDSYGKTPVGWPGFEHHIGDPVEDAVMIPKECKLILVEGIYTLLRDGEWAGLEGLFAETWFLDTPLETAMERLYKRHREVWGMSEDEARARADGNDRLNCEYITPGRERADFLIADR